MEREDGGGRGEDTKSIGGSSTSSRNSGADPDGLLMTGSSRSFRGDNPEDGQEGGPQRAEWGGQLEFILTCVGYAVGLGNVWRFPYLAYKNGGGAFLLPYILMLAFVGLPLFFMELAFGQFASLGPIAIWKLNPVFKGLGYCMVLVSWLIGLYYNVVIAHTLFFLAASLTTELPWQSCGNSWNTEHCIAVIGGGGGVVAGNGTTNGTATNITTLGTTTPSVIGSLVTQSRALLNESIVHGTVHKVIENGNISAVTTVVSSSAAIARTSTEEYYYNHVLQQSEGIDNMGPVSWQLGLCLLVAWVIVAAVLIRGISSLGKVVYFTAIFPYVMLTILLIRGVTLPGAGSGIQFYLTPDFSKLGNPRVWSDAATQIFYSLSACSGGLIAMASYNKFNNNCHRDCLIVALINCATSVYAGLVIFAVLGFMAQEKGVSVGEVADGGPGLAFIVYPEALARMPVAPLWSVFFFIMMATLGFGSQFSIVECVLSAFTDEFPQYLLPKRNNIIFRISVCASMFLLGLPMVSRGGIYLLNLVDFSVSGFPLLFVGLFELAVISWVYGYNKFAEDIYMMLGKKPNLFWKVNWLVVSPLVIIVVILFNCADYAPPLYNDKPYPGWANGLGWCIALFPTLFIPGYAFYFYCRYGGFDLLRFNMLPLSDWGPSAMDNRRGTEYEFSAVPLENIDSPDGGTMMTSQFGSVSSKSRWNTDNIGYIHSVRSMLASRRSLSECSGTESQTTLQQLQNQPMGTRLGLRPSRSAAAAMVSQGEEDGDGVGLV